MPPNKRNGNNVVGTDEVATDYKLQQFLEDVQKFTERSKKSDEKPKRCRKSFDGTKQAFKKRGLFENGFRSKLFLKENKARLKSNLNDLVKECKKTGATEEENLSSNSPSVLEESSELGNQEVDNNKDSNVIPSKNERAADESERLCAPEATNKPSNSLMTIIKDRNELKNLLWEKYCERIKCTQSVTNIFPLEDRLKIAKQRINDMIYRKFLQHAKQYPTILRRIFSNDDIKRLAQIVVKEKVDKCQQTEVVTVSDSVNKNIQCELLTKKDSMLSFPNSSQNSGNSQKEEGSFFGNY
ncbi:unnamed protein product [Nezara viridula]|uniref:Uncharacterized protein n=1 Tax=Nezara viridula TaxID=85310 RepID=A0A9P0E9Q4_NEZVI|nr:unnamed protein product [Nezara viridula]